MKLIKLFVIDDEPKYSKSLKDFLENTGRFELESSELGKTAVAEILRAEPDAVILDMRLEKDHQDGVVLADQIRKGKKLATVPIFIVTNFYSKSEAATQDETSSKRGIFYVAKSESQLKLLARITQVFCEFRRGPVSWSA